MLVATLYAVTIGTVTGLAFWCGAVCRQSGWQWRSRPYRAARPAA